MRQLLKEVRRIVVKVGSSSITRGHFKGIDLQQIRELALQISELHDKGLEVLLVSSGAIASGVDALHLDRRPELIPDIQALAAVGQARLIHSYHSCFEQHGKSVAQFLLSTPDADNPDSRQHAKDALLSSVRLGLIPVINQNDAVNVDEIKFGDNDMLSAHVADIVDADLLIILSDVDGFFDANPHVNPDAKILLEIKEITPQIESLASGSSSGLGSGGMRTKLNAAKFALDHDFYMVLANARMPRVIPRIVDAQPVGSFFHR